MTTPSLSSNDISKLIDYLIKSKDPANIGLRKILKERKEKEEAFPLRTVRFEEFYEPGRTQESPDRNERIILELEKQINDQKILRKRDQMELSETVKQAHEQGKSEGRAQGETAGYEKAKAEFDAVFAEVQKKTVAMLTALEESQRSIYCGAADVLLSLGFEVAKKILNAEVSANPRAVLSVLQKALTYVADKDRIVVKVAKDDAELVSETRNFWIPVGERLSSIVIEEDSRIEKGGCIVESNSGVADARLGVQFNELEEVVRKAWESVNPYNPSAPALPDSAP
jgi:flagellar assembly protein FliH